MEKNIIVTLSICMISILAYAGSSEKLVISGTVPDRGFSILNSGTQIGLQEGTNLKVFIAKSVLNNRTPQSVSSDNSDYEKQNWQRLNQPVRINALSYIRVEAP